jgi:cyclophilin family peptidyl-prolyl cis-trans isomerase
MMRRFTRVYWTFFTVGLISLAPFSGCGDKSAEVPKASIEAKTQKDNTFQLDQAPATDPEPLQLIADGGEMPSPAQPRFGSGSEVMIKTSLGNIHIKLNVEKAPQTVENFVFNYVDTGFYTGTIFHYVDNGSIVAAGGYTADYEPLQTRPPVLSESQNGLKNRRGAVALAHHPDDVHSGTSQFFINVVDNPKFDNTSSENGEPNGYCVFGEVIDGMEVVERIAAAKVHDRDMFVSTPVQPIVIESIERVR